MSTGLREVPCGYLLLTKQGIIKDINENMLSLLEYSYEETAGVHIEKFLSAASRMIFHSLFFIQLTSFGRVEELYLTFKTKNGNDIPILLNGCFTDIADEECIECIIMKITKRDNYEHELQNVKAKLEEAYKLKEEALTKENRLRNLFETILFSIHEGIIVTNDQGNIVLVNKLAEKYTGWLEDDIKGMSLDKVFCCMDILTREKKTFTMEDIHNNDGYVRLENMILVSKDGTERFIMGTTAAILVKDAYIGGTVTSFRDITREYLQEKEIDSFLNVNMEMLCVFDGEGSFYKTNIKFEEVLGFEASELIGRNFLEFVHKEDRDKTLEMLRDITDKNKVYDIVNRFNCKDGSYKYLEWHVQLGTGQYSYASARDITLKMLETENLKTIAIKDQLTNLYNRHYLDMILKDEMRKADSFKEHLTLAILDLDHFKVVNDTWGHPIGDEQLKNTAAVAGKCLRASDLLIRFGGEEFVVLMPKTSIEEAKISLNRVRTAIENNIHPITGKQTVSIGAAEKLENESFDEWYRRADEALYHAKDEGRNRVTVWKAKYSEPSDAGIG